MGRENVEVAHRRLRSPASAPLDLDAIARELDLPGAFPDDVVAAARNAAGRSHPNHRDATDLALVTIDPPGSTDLDQAVAIEDRGDGWRVCYAIADVAAWVDHAGPAAREAWARTQTHYLPHDRIPLHPAELSEAAASLLPDGDRPALLWTIDVDGDGRTTAVDLERALVRSRAQLTYDQVQHALDRGAVEALPAGVRALPAIGAVLVDAGLQRGAIELGLPEQDVVASPDGGWSLRLRAELAVERWNAQISLLTGRAAATVMLDAGFGLLRTLPAPDPAIFPRLRQAARSLGVRWDEGEHPGVALARLDTGRPAEAAFADLAAELLRGAGYTAFDGDLPEDPGHAGVGAPYAHVTAPLRRLVDRFTGEVCLAHVAGQPVPDWAQEGVAKLPEAMADGDRRARALDRAIVDATEALVLADRVGDVFEAYVAESGERFGTVVLRDPPVRARCDTADLPLGEEVRVRCTDADVAARVVRFARVP